MTATKQNPFSKISKGWFILAEFAAWILTVASTFLITPPMLKFSVESKTVPLTSFLVAALSGLIFIPLLKKGSYKDYKLWYRCAIFSLIIAVASTASYNYYIDEWGVEYYGSTLIKGDTLVNDASVFKEKTEKSKGREIGEEELVKMYSGQTDKIWLNTTLRKRYYLITTLYIFDVIVIGAFILTIIQAIFCFQSRPSSGPKSP